MQTLRWARLQAALGIIDVVLTLIALLIVPTTPAVGASTQQVVSYYTASGTTFLISGYLGMFASVFFLWFMGYLNRVLGQAEGGTKPFSTLAFGAAVAAAAVYVIFSAIAQTLPFRVTSRGDFVVVRALSDIAEIGLSASVFPGLLLVSAVSLALLRTRVLPRWVGVFGLGVVGALLVASLSLLVRSGPLVAGGLVFLSGYSLFLLVVSLVLVVKAGSVGEASSSFGRTESGSVPA